VTPKTGHEVASEQVSKASSCERNATDNRPKAVLCPLCHKPSEPWFQGTDLFYEVTDFMGSYWYCPACDFGFMNPVPCRETIASFYPGGYWQESKKAGLLSRLEDLYVRSILRMDLYRWVRRGLAFSGFKGHYVDLGCSRGDLAASFKNSGVMVSGVDGDARAVSYARECHNLHVEQADLETWEPETSFQTISAFHVLEHVREPIVFLKQLHRCMSEGAHLVLRVPNSGSWQAKAFKKSWKGWELPRHISHFTPASLRKSLEIAGFKVVSMSTWSLRDGPPAMTSSLLRWGEPTWQLIKQRPNSLLKVLYLLLNSLLIPIEVIAAMLGRGAMLTVICRPKPQKGR